MFGMSEIYSRQKELNLSIPSSVAVIGVGGVGSWTAFNLALTGVKKLILIDYDVVEKHNLNRTPFKITQVGLPKVTALTQLITVRRPETEVITIAKKIEECNELELEMIKSCEEIIDCRDTSKQLPPEIEEKARKIVAGYDGFKVTIHLNRKPKTVWGDGQVTYTVTPSWLVPPQLLANLITLYLCCPEIQENEEKVITFDVRELFNKIR